MVHLLASLATASRLNFESVFSTFTRPSFKENLRHASIEFESLLKLAIINTLTTGSRSRLLAGPMPTVSTRT
jgi:hypothetical protein